MLFIILLISFAVQIYSIGYLKDDPFLLRFLAYLNFFTFFMLFLVISNNLLQAFLGWEGVGLVSFLLINFWHMRVFAFKSALKAVFLNKFGDLALLVFLILILKKFGTLEYLLWLPLCFFWQEADFLVSFCSDFDFLSFFLILAAIVKSAQFGLHLWLPDAMEGPTPVSALLHAATMVTAGVFLLLRCSALLEVSKFALTFLFYFGLFTMLLGGLLALGALDFKKIVAYSTCSQLGLMFFSCGLSQYNEVIFHLINHAFFKALLFLSVGLIIHNLKESQDLFNSTNESFSLDTVISLMILGSTAIVGLPLASGFFFKRYNFF